MWQRPSKRWRGVGRSAHQICRFARTRAAEIALAENDGVGAIRELDSSRATAADLAQNYWYIADELIPTGHPLEARAPSSNAKRYLTDTTRCAPAAKNCSQDP